MINLKKIYHFLFFLGLFFMPFNSFDGFSGLGEFSRESCIFFFGLGLFFFMCEVLMNKKLIFPIFKKSYFGFLLFVLFCLLTVIFNLDEVFRNYFKQTSGLERFSRQYIVLVLSGVVFFTYYYHIFLEHSLDRLFIKVRKIFTLSFIIVTAYSSLEILIVYFGQNAFEPIIQFFNYFPFTQVKLDFTFRRISSVTWEPPYLAIYLITIAGWMFSYILTAKGFKRFLPTIVVLVLTFFSGSRTALVVVFAQFIVFLWTILNFRKYQKYLAYFFAVFVFAFGLVLIASKGKVIGSIQEKVETLNFKENLTESISNKSRFGIQYANLQVFKNNPLVGVGYGQQTFHSKKFYPLWATKNNYEFENTYLNQNIKAFPPGYNLYIRLLAETGIIGTLIFLFFLVSIGLQVRNLLIRHRNHEIMRNFVITLIVSYFGFLINWMQVDTMRLFGFWIFLALLIRIEKET